jgi:hypothetical protein
MIPHGDFFAVQCIALKGTGTGGTDNKLHINKLLACDACAALPEDPLQ